MQTFKEVIVFCLFNIMIISLIIEAEAWQMKHPRTMVLQSWISYRTGPKTVPVHHHRVDYVQMHLILDFPDAQSFLGAVRVPAGYLDKLFLWSSQCKKISLARSRAENIRSISEESLYMPKLMRTVAGTPSLSCKTCVQ